MGPGASQKFGGKNPGGKPISILGGGNPKLGAQKREVFLKPKARLQNWGALFKPQIFGGGVAEKHGKRF